MCSECQVWSIETDIVIEPVPPVEPDVEAPRNEEGLPVSANTRSTKKKKVSVLELGEILEKTASMKESVGS